MAGSFPQTFSARHLGSQIILSRTSHALNYAETQSVESKADFVHKMKICQKNLREASVHNKAQQASNR
ncbi:MAG: four helix bundle protein [Saprospiraceae bacterium]